MRIATLEHSDQLRETALERYVAYLERLDIAALRTEARKSEDKHFGTTQIRLSWKLL